ncbi:MAG: hypothetical protein HS126_02140 [Anaerolineales bacterium]|nr:hypothetical protein [Anaerolineales bacterium]
MDDSFPVLIWIFFIGIVVIYSIISQQNREKQKSAWRQLALAHNLIFVPNNSYFGNGAYVEGRYRGYSLKLETIEKKHGKSSVTYTRLKIFANRWPGERQSKTQSEPPLSFQEALNRFTAPNFGYGLDGEIKAEPGGQLIYYEQRDVIQDTQFLKYLLDLLTSLVEAYPIVVAGGAEVIPALPPALANKALGEFALQVLRDIAEETARRLAPRAHRLLCPRCLTRFGPHKAELSWWNSRTYYGCRTCGQSRKFLEGPVIAVLDNRLPAAPIQQDGTVRINWSARRELFDFDTVEIVQASDEDVERFAVQVGNDTDPSRRSRYKEMPCVVRPDCQLSENSLRILRQIFGQTMEGAEENRPGQEGQNAL